MFSDIFLIFYFNLIFIIRNKNKILNRVTMGRSLIYEIFVALKNGKLSDVVVKVPEKLSKTVK